MENEVNLRDGVFLQNERIIISQCNDNKDFPLKEQIEKSAGFFGSKSRDIKDIKMVLPVTRIVSVG